MEQIPISQMLGIANTTPYFKHSKLVATSIFYPVIFKVDWISDIDPEGKEKIEKIRSHYAAIHGEIGKKRLDEDDLHRSIQIRLLLCKTNNLMHLKKDWGPEDEQTEFEDGQYADPLLMKILNGHKIEFREDKS